MDNEVWKPYPEFSFVEVSSIGRVRTLDRVVLRKNGRKNIVKGHVLKQWRNSGGYLLVSFGINGKVVAILVHRLVAQTFIPNPDNLPEVNHKDCDRTNNCVSNLEWCTGQYNVAYKEKYGISAKEATKVLNHPVYAVNLKTLEVSRFESQMEAGRSLGVAQQSISAVIKGRYSQTKGYWFTNADSNAVEATRYKFGDVVADKVNELMNELQPA